MRRKIPILLIIAIVLALLVWWRYWPDNKRPKNEIVWSLAVVRSLGGFTRNTSTEFYAATTGAVYVPATFGGSWTKKPLSRPDTRLVALAVDRNGIIAGGTIEGEVYVSTDLGDNWSTYQVSKFPVSSIVILEEGRYLAATFGDGIYEFRKEYATWKRFDAGPIDLNVWSLALDETNHALMAITPRGAYLTTVNGSWKRISARTTTTACAFSGAGRFLAQKGNNLLVSNDRGKTSSQIIFGDGRALDVWSLAGDGDGDAVVGTTSGIYWSNDSGRTWKNLEASYVLAETASIFPFEGTALAQEIVPPRVEIPRIGPTGPPVLPPLETGRNIGQIPKLETPLNPPTQAPQARIPPTQAQATTGNSGSTGSAPPRLPSSEVNSSGTSSTESPIVDPNGGGPPPPPPPSVTPVRPFPGLACGQTDESRIECNSKEVVEYLESVLTAKDIAEIVAKMVAEAIVGEKDIYVVATDLAVDAGKDKAVEELLKRVITTMMDRAVQKVHAFAQATNSAPLIAEVRAHEAYVKSIQAEAIRESIKSVDISFESQDFRHSNLSFNTSGPAFHQLSYSAVHGAGWW